MTAAARRPDRCGQGWRQAVEELVLVNLEKGTSEELAYNAFYNLFVLGMARVCTSRSRVRPPHTDGSCGARAGQLRPAVTAQGDEDARALQPQKRNARRAKVESILRCRCV